MIKANFDSYASYQTDSIYQWDLNRVLHISGLNLANAPEVHFANANMDRAIVKQAELVNHVVKVQIPNSILQDPLPIKAYIGVYEGDTFKVVEMISIPVIPKARPFDYQIEDTDEEIYSFKALENMVANALIVFSETKENKAEITTKVMLANKWSNSGTYSFENDYPVGTYNIEIALNNTATTEQATAFNSAKIVGSATTNIVKAYGTIPTVNIPIIVKAVRL